MTRALAIGTRGTWAFVGAGGKTSAIRRLLGENPQALATTTTHLAASGFDIGALAVAADAGGLERLETALGGVRPLTLALGGGGGRLHAPPLDWQQRFAIRHARERVFVEADGARRRLVKLPGAHEPALPPVPLAGVVVVLGCDALGRPLGAVAHRPERFRPSRAGARRVGVADLETMLRQYLRRVPPQVPCAVLLTGVDDADRMRLVARLGARATRARASSPVRLVATPDVEGGTYWVWARRASRARPRAPRGDFPAVDGILLAAGRGARFGAAPGGSKLLQPWRGRTLVEHAVAAWSGVGFGALWIVTGHAAAAVAARAAGVAGPGGRRRVAFNRDHARGLGTSVRLGARRARAGAALVFGHADMPRLGTATLRRVVAAGEALRTRIVVPTVGGQPRNPVYFPADLRRRLRSIGAERGGKSVIDAYPARVVRLPMDDVAREFLDVDRPGDLSRLRRVAAAPRARTR